MQPLRPFILGSEFAGRIAQDSPIPERCPFKRGDKVFGAIQGAYADQLAVKWTLLLPLPPGMTFDEGAGGNYPSPSFSSTDFVSLTGLFLTWPTSYEALKGRAELKAGQLSQDPHPTSAHDVLGEWVLVTASAGGVGIAAVQLAKGHPGGSEDP